MLALARPLNPDSGLGPVPCPTLPAPPFPPPTFASRSFIHSSVASEFSTSLFSFFLPLLAVLLAAQPPACPVLAILARGKESALRKQAIHSFPEEAAGNQPTHSPNTLAPTTTRYSSTAH